MRRVLAIVLMLLVPLQFAWSATQSVHGHTGSDAFVFGFHSHDGDHAHHGDDEHAAPDESVAGSGGSSDSDDGHPGGHYHPIFVSLVIDAELALHDASPGGPPTRPPAALTSRTPALFDWPPSARWR